MAYACVLKQCMHVTCIVSNLALRCRALLGSLIWMLRWTSSAVQASPHNEEEGAGGALSFRAPRSAKPKTLSLVSLRLVLPSLACFCKTNQAQCLSVPR